MTGAADLARITWFAGAGGLALALFLTPLVARLMRRLGALDVPGGRHGHDRPTPRGGGLALVAGLVFGFWLSGLPFAGPLKGLLAGLAVLVPLCLLDDIWRLPPRPRLLGQIIAASLAWRFGIRIEGVTNILSHFFGQHYLSLGLISWPVTVLWLVALTNAMNWIDGVDGLAAGVAAIAAATFAYMGFGGGMADVACLAAAVAGASLGFLRYNFSPASVFMGDVGAMSLGFTLAALATTGAFKSTAVTALAAPLLVSGVPLYDVISTMWGRWRRGQALDAADRTHVHHRLLGRGFSPVQTCLLLYLVTALLCFVAILLWRL
jgi:UDP-GlcNAc:undecaprenyl-phosphate GlcNAc-1-phosphate transferase